MSHGQMIKTRASKQSKRVFSKEAHSYQTKGIKWLLSNGAAALLFDPGMGKTAVVLKAFDALRRAKTGMRALVIAPLRVCQLVWPAEPNEWSDLEHLRVGLLHGPKREQVLENLDDYDVCVINPEGLSWLLTGKHNGREVDMRRFKSFGFDTLIIDELTKFKHTRGVRFKMLKRVLRTFQRRWGLTGTPAPNGLIDLFGQMYVLDLGNALGEYITHYRMKYFYNPDGNGWKWVLQSGAAEIIYERIRPLALRASAEDYLELPDIIPLKVMVQLPPKIRKLYEELEEDLISKIEEKQVVASNAAAASTKCRQIANGAVYIDDDLVSRIQGKRRDVAELHDSKLEALAELVEDLNGEQLLVAYEFNHDADRLRKRFPDAKFMSDAKTQKQAKEIEDAWNSGELTLLFGHPGNMGHGLNFQKSNASHVAYFSMVWDLELYDQFIKRVRRQGNKSKRVFVHHFMTENTIDETVFYVLRSKDKTQTALLDALKGRRK